MPGSVAGWWGRVRAGTGVVRVEEREGGDRVAVVKNPSVVPMAVIEVLIAAALCSLNYCLRYDTSIVEDCSMVNWAVVTLSCADLPHLAFPLYNSSEHDTTAASTFALPDTVFFPCVVFVPVGLVALVEVVRSRLKGRKLKEVDTGCMVVPLLIRRLLRFSLVLLTGGAGVGVLVSVLKLLVVAPRPHLLAACNGNPATVCSSSHTWQPEDVCSSENPPQVHEALRAFPSYHAAIAIYSGVWTWAYLSRRAQVTGVYGGQVVLVGSVLVMALLGATHGYTTYSSSLLDVVVGGLLGALAALYVAFIVLRGFKERKWKVSVVKVEADKVPKDDPKLLPIVSLGGQPDLLDKAEVRDLGDFDSSSSSSEDEGELSSVGVGSDAFPIIPRATTTTTFPRVSRAPKSSLPPAQAVNPILNAHPPRNPRTGPLPPPPPPPPPPPDYTRPEKGAIHSRQYNIPRQRSSAPTPGGQPPRLTTHTLPSRSIAFTLHSAVRNPEDHHPRARTDTSSYF